MLRTVVGCDEELTKLNAQFKRLEMERKHILKVRAFLVENGDQIVREVNTKLTNTDLVLQAIRESPGIDGLALRAKLADELTPRQVQSTMANLVQFGRIEKRGKQGKNGLWYIKEV